MADSDPHRFSQPTWVRATGQPYTAPELRYVHVFENPFCQWPSGWCVMLKVQVSIPPPQDATMMETDPNIVQGPWKCCPPQREMENSDPQAKKKLKANPALRKWMTTNDSQHVGTGDIHKDIPHPCPQPVLSARNLDAGSSDDAPDISPGTCNAASENKSISSDNSDEDDEPEVEDDITELSNIVFTCSS
ncbi:hypothetical protein EI94DRAFT_1701919 [Lactarius quietus]|nr:hypothetical protein EI94DRAFT_1701919 [Lactarius quietus]